MLLYFVYDFRHSVEMMLISTSGDFISQFGLKLYIQGLYCKLRIIVSDNVSCPSIDNFLYIDTIRIILFSLTLPQRKTVWQHETSLAIAI